MISYRKFENKDLDQLLSVYLQGFSALYGDTTQQYAEEFLELYESALIEGVEGEMFIAEKDNNIIGFAVIHQESTTEFKFGPIVVVPIFQRRGIGSKLLQLCINFARSNRVKQFYLKVNDNNQAAVAFYKKFGFSIIEAFPSDVEGHNFLKMVYTL
ncbi:MAG: GNAT family N-acetyltransferase [Candidatus Helarchaeota archaeon]|nr:GNAT family N-acetyltransferase [Candidatus Helarchaeota archaeon]